jgi:hypothetical protein
MNDPQYWLKNADFFHPYSMAVVKTLPWMPERKFFVTTGILVLNWKPLLYLT